MITNYLKTKKAERELDRILLEGALDNYKEAMRSVPGSDVQTDYLTVAKKFEKMRQQNELNKCHIKSDFLRIPIEIGKVILPLAVYVALWKAGLAFEETGSFRSSLVRSVINKGPRMI